MLFKRFYDETLAQASYLVGCQATGDAIVVDPTRDVAQYLDAARAEKVRVTHVAETHIHADFVSGARELARKAGATLLLSAEGGEGWQYAYAADDGARLLHDGDRVMVGNVALDVMHTPGHTPEHLSFVVTDTPANAGPMGVITGDFVFVGDVGRPDLLERAAGQSGTMDASARALFRSLGRFRALPDHLQLWPGHGAGSACGKSLGAVPASTVGYEKKANWALGEWTEDAFVAEVLAGQPEPPAYFARMKRVNRDGPADAPARELRAFDADSSGTLGACVAVDVRPAPEFAERHLRGALSVPLGRSFVPWAGSVVPDDRCLYLIADGEAAARDAAHALALIGFDRVRGWVDAGVAEQWGAARGELDAVRQMSAGELAAARASGEITVLDVRTQAEWDAGHLAGARHVPLQQLARRIAEVPRDQPLVVHCQGGSRSAVAASLLQAAGVEDVRNLTGGYGGWARDGHPVTLDGLGAPPAARPGA